MARGIVGRRILPAAMTVALVGTAWIGLAGGPLVSGAFAQRTDSKEEEDRKRRGQPRQERQERQDRSAPRTTAPSGSATQNPGTRPERSGRPERPERQDRVAPRQVEPPQRQVAPPQITPPPSSGRVGTPDDRRGRERDERFRAPEGSRPTFGSPQGRPPGSGDDRAKGFAPPARDPVREGRPPQLPDRGPSTTGRRPDGRGDPGRRDDRASRFGSGPQRLDEVKRGRVERVEGGRRVIEEPGNRFIIRDKDRVVIRRDEGRAFERFAPNARSRDLGEGRRETVLERADGSRVFTEVDRNGRLLRRYRRDRSGREVVLIDNRRFYRNVGIGIGVTALGIGVGLALAPPAYSIPRDKYIVEYDDASDDDIYEALSAPPVAELDRPYSLDEIRYTRSLREYMRRIDLDTVNFEFGSFEVTPDQYPKLERLARMIHRMLDRNPAEVFFIEGHTDAVGSDEDNLTLSDRRAESVAEILMSQFDVPIENLVTQGYGEQFLKVETQAPERLNRRVAFRRITPLLGLQGR